MISVLLLGFDASGQQAAAPRDAVRTLAALVPATVDGVVRDLCLAGPGADRGLADVADHAGCGFVAAAGFVEALHAGARQLRCPLVLVTRAGMVADRPFFEELSALLPILGEGSPAYVLRAARHDLVGRLFPSAGAAAAVLAPRSWLETARAASMNELARRASPRRTFKTRVWLDA